MAVNKPVTITVKNNIINHNINQHYLDVQYKMYLYPAAAKWQNPELVCYRNTQRVIVGKGRLIIVPTENNMNQ